MNLLTVSLLVMGVFCILYFVTILLYTGPQSAFLWFWIVTGTILIVAASICTFMDSNKIITPIYIKLAVVVPLFLGAVIFIIIEIRIISAGNKKVSTWAGYVIVLGAQVKGKALSKTLKSRLDTACQYLRVNNKAKVIVSGGQGNGEDISEAEAMSNYLKEQGIQPYRIIKEDQSTNTYENIKFSRKYLKGENPLKVENSLRGENPLKKENSLKEEMPLVILVTSNFHVYRAINIAKKQGLKVQGLGAPVDDILALNYYIREFFAVVKDRLFGNI